MLPIIKKRDTQHKKDELKRPVGRDAEIERFEQALSRVQAGQSVCMLFSGQEGLGKTTLFSYFKAQARQDGNLVFDASANESADSNPYQPVFAALGLGFGPSGSVVRSDVARDNAREFGMESVVKAVNIVNAINSVIPNPIGVAIGLSEMAVRVSRFNRRKRREREQNAGGNVTNKNFQAIHQALLETYEEHYKRAPIVLILDEMQYARETTFKLLDALVTASFPILLLLGWDDNNTPLPVLLRNLVERTHGDIIELHPLPRAEILKVIDEYTADPKNQAIAEIVAAHRDQLAEFSSGLPGVVQDSVDYLAQGGDPALFSASDDSADASERGARLVDALTSKYLDVLDSDVRGALECAAVIGRHFPFDLIASESLREYLGLTTNQRRVLKQLASMAGQQHIISAAEHNPRMFSFDSVYVYNTLLRQLPLALQQIDHQEIAHAWEKLAAEQGNVEKVASELARHFYAAERYEPASRYYMAVATRLFNETAYSEAIAIYAQVLACLDHMPTSSESNAIRVGVLTTSSLAYEYLGKNGQAIDNLESALAALANADDSDRAEDGQSSEQRRADLLGHLGWLYFKVGSNDKAAGYFDVCEQLYAEANDTSGLVRVGIYRGTMFSQERNYEAAIKELEGCLEQYERHGITSAAVVSGQLDATQMAEAEDLDRVYLELGLLYNRMRRLAQAEAYLRVALSISEAQADRAAVVQGKHYLGQCLSLQGKEEAIEHLMAAEQEAREQLKDRYLAASIGNTLAYAYQSLGQSALGTATFERLIPELMNLDDKYGLGAAYGGLGGLYARMWKLDEAIDYLQRDLDLVNADARPSANLVSKLSNQLADLQRLKGDYAQGLVNVQVSRAAADLGDEAAQAHSEGFAALTEARIYADQGHLDKAQAALAEAKARLADIADMHTAIAAVEGQIARLRHDWATARQLLTASLEAQRPEDDNYDLAIIGLELTRLSHDMGENEAARKWAAWTAEKARQFGNERLAELASQTLTP